MLLATPILITGCNESKAAENNKTKEYKTIQMHMPFERLYYSDINNQVYVTASTGGSVAGTTNLYYHNYILYYSENDGFYFYDQNETKQKISEDEVYNQ